MRGVGWKVAFVLSFFGASAWADPITSVGTEFIAKLRDLHPVDTTKGEVERVLGNPQIEAGAGDGMTLLTYTQDTNGSANIGDNISGLSDMAGLAAFLLPTQLGMATELASAAAGLGGKALSTGSGAGSSSDYSIKILFDRDGRLMSWRGVVDGREVNLQDQGLMPHASEDDLQKRAQEIASHPPSPSDGKPHLGASVAVVPGGLANPEIIGNTGLVGLWILALQPNSAVGRAGLRPNDIVWALDGELITSMDELQRILARAHVGTAMDALYWKYDTANNKMNLVQTKIAF